MLADKPEGCGEKRKVAGCSMEIYGQTSTRYICITGNEFQDSPVLDEQEALERLARNFGFIGEMTGEGATTSGVTPDCDIDTDDEPHTDEEIWQLLKQNNKQGRITRLIAGDTVEFDGDASSADLALCSHIAYYTRSPDQIDRLFRRSKLADRDKWRERGDYRDRTIEKALSGCEENYWESRARRALEVAHQAAQLTEAEASLSGGFQGLHRTVKGVVKDDLHNAVEIIGRDKALSGCFKLNEFSGYIEVCRSPEPRPGLPQPLTLGPLTDAHELAVRRYVNTIYGVDFGGTVGEAIVCVASEHSFNPLTDKLSALGAAWDGVPRLHRWLADYIGAENDGCEEYVSQIGTAFTISAVARAFRPGCKADCMLVLEGAQGLGKSRAAHAVCRVVYPEGFTDGISLAGHGADELFIELQGKWIVELSELTGFSRADSALLKNQLSRTEDRGRAKYGRLSKSWPRRCVFIGTTNEDEYIPDASGARRFWGVRVRNKIDVDRLVEVAPMLWGEAVVRCQRGEPWHLTDATAISQAAAQQGERLATDPLDDRLLRYAERMIEEKPYWLSSIWPLIDIWNALHEPDTERFGPVEKRRLEGALQRVGFERARTERYRGWKATPELVNRAGGWNPSTVRGSREGGLRRRATSERSVSGQTDTA
jgi:hypothetical protein